VWACVPFLRSLLESRDQVLMRRSPIAVLTSRAVSPEIAQFARNEISRDPSERIINREFLKQRGRKEEDESTS